MHRWPKTCAVLKCSAILSVSRRSLRYIGLQVALGTEAYQSRAGVKTAYHGGLKSFDTQTNSAQAVVGQRLTDAFGNQISSSGVWKGRFAYGGPYGYQEDPDMALRLLGHRYYDSSTGRFLTRDPIKDGRNWYVYCEGRPTIKSDPNGLQAVIISYDLTPKWGRPTAGGSLGIGFDDNGDFFYETGASGGFTAGLGYPASIWFDPYVEAGGDLVYDSESTTTTVQLPGIGLQMANDDIMSPWPSAIGFGVGLSFALTKGKSRRVNLSELSRRVRRAINDMINSSMSWQSPAFFPVISENPLGKIWRP